MRILVACEESQAVTIAFRNKGHEAYSCDLQPCSGGHPEWHIQDDVLAIMPGLRYKRWDMMIAHPPCTYLTNAANRFLRDEERMKKRAKAIHFAMQLFNTPIYRVCMENPCGILNSAFRKADQTIHPYFFGDKEVKRTCLWLKNLPPLQYTAVPDLFSSKITVVEKPEPAFQWVNSKGQVKKEYYTYSKNSKERSKTFPSIAQAMAEQWG